MRILIALLQKPLTRWIGVITINLLALWIMVSLLTSHQAKPSQNMLTPILTQLHQIKTQLNQLEQHLSQAEKTDLTILNHEVEQLKYLIKEIKSYNGSELNQFMQENNNVLNTKLETIQIELNSLNQKQHPILFLPASALPFQLVSIDSIQQISVVNVLYNFKVIPLEKDDSLAAWTVVRVDFGKQSAEFVNSKKEHVVVTLEHEEGEQHA
jgi:hypothetical protein